MRRRNSGRNDLVHLLGLLTLYVITSPFERTERAHAELMKRNEANQALASGDGGNGDASASDSEASGLVIFAGLFIVVGILSGSGEIFTFCLFIAAVLFIADKCGGSNSNNTSSANNVQQGANQPYYNPEVYGYSNAQQSASQQSIAGVQANCANVQAAQPFVPNLATHVFVPDEWTADLLKEVSLSERLRYLNVDSVGELIEKFPTCTDDDDLIEFRYGEKSVVRAKRKVVADKYRYMPADFDPNLVVPIAAMAVPAAMYYDDDDDDDEPSFFSNGNAHEQTAQQRPAWQDPYAYHGTEKYDEFYNLREDEYREEYGEDFEDAIDNEYEETYINK